MVRGAATLTSAAQAMSCVALVLLLASTAASSSTARAQDQAPGSGTALGLEVMTDQLRLPVHVLPLDDGSRRLLVTQLEGLVVLVAPDGSSAELPFLDLRHRVTGLEGEQGLFSATLEPASRAAARNRARHLVVAFTERDSGDLVIAGYPVDPSLERADEQAEVLLLRIPMPEPYHHGGQVTFGPDDYLYVSVGDGLSESRTLPFTLAPAASLGHRRGSLLRIDPFPVDGAAPYLIPPDNPFVGHQPDRGDPDAASEIWAYGFRNPWRFGFDARSGALLLSDPGTDRWEVIHRVVRGGDHGWPSREGPSCSLVPGTEVLYDPDCDERAHVPALVALPHASRDPAGARAIVAGVVVTDPDLPSLAGRYLFGDVVSGRLWALDLDRGDVELVLETGRRLTAIVTGANDEVLMVSLEGVLARLAPIRAP